MGGVKFEKTILGYRFGNVPAGDYRSFERSMREIIRQENPASHPDTYMGALLYFGVKRRLEKLGLNTKAKGMLFLPTNESRADIYHSTDAIFYLPCFPKYVATLDLFSLDPKIVKLLKEKWVNESDGFYTEEDFQSNLYNHKMGVKRRLKEGKIISGWDRIFLPIDFQVRRSRPENHFILTQYHTENRVNRKRFCQVVADYFARVILNKKAV